MPRFLRGLAPDIERHLLSDEGEAVIDEVPHHWVVYTVSMLEWLLAVVVLLIMLQSRLDGAGILFLVALALAGHGFWRFLVGFRDRFVITNMRVMRISGVLSSKLATTPISRILDITVDKPWIGRMLGFGHFVFESAAQEQGIRDIRYVGHPDERDLTIQRVIQRSGLRTFVPDLDGTGDYGSNRGGRYDEVEPFEEQGELSEPGAPDVVDPGHQHESGHQHEPGQESRGRHARERDFDGDDEVTGVINGGGTSDRGGSGRSRRSANTIFSSDDPRWDDHPRA